MSCVSEDTCVWWSTNSNCSACLHLHKALEPFRAMGAGVALHRCHPMPSDDEDVQLPGLANASQLGRPWAEAARRFPNIKFMKGVASEA